MGIATGINGQIAKTFLTKHDFPQDHPVAAQNKADVINARISQGGTWADAARAVGIMPGTVYQYLCKDPNFRARLAELTPHLKGAALQRLTTIVTSEVSKDADAIQAAKELLRIADDGTIPQDNTINLLGIVQQLSASSLGGFLSGALGELAETAEVEAVPAPAAIGDDDSGLTEADFITAIHSDSFPADSRPPVLADCPSDDATSSIHGSITPPYVPAPEDPVGEVTTPKFSQPFLKPD
jgi:hypothetical protein